jgi:hypothetical protein
MPTVKNVGEPCAGEPHARFDGGREETRPVGKTARPRRLPSTRPLPSGPALSDERVPRRSSDDRSCSCYRLGRVGIAAAMGVRHRVLSHGDERVGRGDLYARGDAGGGACASWSAAITGTDLDHGAAVMGLVQPVCRPLRGRASTRSRRAVLHRSTSRVLATWPRPSRPAPNRKWVIPGTRSSTQTRSSDCRLLARANVARDGCPQRRSETEKCAAATNHEYRRAL